MARKERMSSKNLDHNTNILSGKSMLISCRKVIYATVTPSVFPKNQTANRYWEPQKTGEELYQAYFDMSSNRSIDPLAK